MPNFPEGSSWERIRITDNQEIVLATNEEKVASAFASIPTEYHDILLTVIVPHGRIVFATMEDLLN